MMGELHKAIKRQRFHPGRLCITRPSLCLMQASFEKIPPMQQTTLDLDLHLKKAREREFLEQMNEVVPWAALVVGLTH